MNYYSVEVMRNVADVFESVRKRFEVLKYMKIDTEMVGRRVDELNEKVWAVYDTIVDVYLEGVGLNYETEEEAVKAARADFIRQGYKFYRESDMTFSLWFDEYDIEGDKGKLTPEGALADYDDSEVKKFILENWEELLELDEMDLENDFGR